MPVLAPSARQILRSPDPFAGVDPTRWASHADLLAELYMAETGTSVDDLIRAWSAAFTGLLDGSSIRGTAIRHLPTMLPRLFSQMLHEEVAKDLGQLPGWRLGVNEQQEKDVEHLADPALSLELKGNQSRSGVSANRSYVSESGNKSRSSWYLVWNYAPPARKGVLQTPRLHSLRLGHIRALDWDTDRIDSGKARGQIVGLRRESQARLATIWTPAADHFAEPAGPSRPAPRARRRPGRCSTPARDAVREFSA